MWQVKNSIGNITQDTVEYLNMDDTLLHQQCFSIENTILQDNEFQPIDIRPATPPPDHSDDESDIPSNWSVKTPVPKTNVKPVANLEIKSRQRKRKEWLQRHPLYEFPVGSQPRPLPVIRDTYPKHQRGTGGNIILNILMFTNYLFIMNSKTC